MGERSTEWKDLCRKGWRISARRIARAALKTGRQPADVQLVAVTKMVPVERIGEAISCGLKVFGENRVQDFLAKYEAWGDRVEWHLIGHLQQNKAKYLAGKISLVHSLDSIGLARHLDRLSEGQEHPWRVLIQVNVAGEATKHGLAPEEVPAFLDQIRSLKGLDVVRVDDYRPLRGGPGSGASRLPEVAVIAGGNVPGQAVAELAAPVDGHEQRF